MNFSFKKPLKPLSNDWTVAKECIDVVSTVWFTIWKKKKKNLGLGSIHLTPMS